MNGEIDPRATPLGERLLAFCVRQLEAAEASYAPGLRLPGVYAGHRVGADARADLAFTLGLLWEAGIRQVGRVDLEQGLVQLLSSIDGGATHSFFSYRVAETLARFGPFAGNPLLRRLSPEQRAGVAAACASPGWSGRIERKEVLGHNAAVLGRVEHARRKLGLLEDDSVLRQMVAATARLLSSPGGWVDDSLHDSARYDIYSADIYLFSEPLAPLLGNVWREGARRVLDALARIVASDGTAFPWGRSTGALGMALTIGLCGLVHRHDLVDRPAAWLVAADQAFARIQEWLVGGMVTAHQGRCSDPYRGPARRLQMTFDLLGKLADAALHLRGATAVEGEDIGQAFGACDEVLWFDRARWSGVWAYRSAELAFCLPLTGCTTSDYLPAPRAPGLFEAPGGTDQVVGVPFLLAGGRRYVGGGLPRAVEKLPGGIRLRFDGWPLAGQTEGENGGPVWPGSRDVSYRVEGRTLVVDEQIELAEAPETLALQVAEAQARPLRFGYGSSDLRSVCHINTSGMSEWRSFWGELPRVHQLEIEPRAKVRLSWSVTPKLRVLTSFQGHAYHRSLYDHLQEEVFEGEIPFPFLPDTPTLVRFLRDWDVFHLHWPEIFLRSDLPAHRQLIAALRQARVPVVWTQHNLEPHSKDPGEAALFGQWAAAADGVIHHSAWGRGQVLARYPFSPSALHRVIPHPHFGHLRTGGGEQGRPSLERQLGLRPGVLRLAVVGAPRREKRIDIATRAVRACRRQDIELLVFCGDQQPAVADPRIRTFVYEKVPRLQYDQRLSVVDALVLPFERQGMLTTGTIADVIGSGLPALVSDWPFLTETLGGAGICYGQTAEELATCLQALRPEQLVAAAAHSRGLRAHHEPARLARETVDLLFAVVQRPLAPAAAPVPGGPQGVGGAGSQERGKPLST